MKTLYQNILHSFIKRKYIAVFQKQYNQNNINISNISVKTHYKCAIGLTINENTAKHRLMFYLPNNVDK